jgi:hypothetical protein
MGHQPFCAHPSHSLITYCSASEDDPVTLAGKPSRAWFRDHPGADPRWPLILASRDELDLSLIRRHVMKMHSRHAPRVRVPRSNRDLAPWHFAQHFRLHQGHLHGGPFVLIRDAYGRTIGQITRPLGWYTGQDAKTREQVRAEWLAAHPPHITREQEN